MILDCTFGTAVRIREVTGSFDIIRDFHDHDNGVDVINEIQMPQPGRKRQGRRKSARVHGSFPRGARLGDDDTLIFDILVEGATWTEQATRAAAILADFEANEELYVETELDGVRTRYFTDAPVDMLPEPIGKTQRILCRQNYQLRFLVQPFPTVTIV